MLNVALLLFMPSPRDTAMDKTDQNPCLCGGYILE